MKKVKIGLEVHIQLNTKSKLFCGCSAEQTEEPNKNVCEICLGFPGSKPVLNKKAVEMAVMIGYALNCNINKNFLFSRKTYFYPDMSRNFQITQLETPVATDGKVLLKDKVIRIRRAHLEDDPAKIVRTEDGVLVDYNRSGTPLVEIVTEPDIESPAEARQFIQKLQQILEFIYVTDSDKEGNMRADANISLSSFDDNYDSKRGYVRKEIEGTRVEIKNISGAKEVERALSYEVLRQKNIKQIKRETRLWNEKTRTTISAREKEEEEDYGYIFEPDLPPVELSETTLKKIKSDLPELPDEKKKRFLKLGISEEIVDTLLTEPEISNYFEKLCEKHNEKASAIVLAKYLKKTLNYHGKKLRELPIKLTEIEKVLELLESYKITDAMAEIIIRELVSDTIKSKKIRTVESVINELNYEKISDKDKLVEIIQEVLDENKKAIKSYLEGESKPFEFLVGQVMRKTKRSAEISKVRELLKKELENIS